MLFLSVLKELLELKVGWLNGEGVAYSLHDILYVHNILTPRISSRVLSLIKCYPTVNGEIRLEWSERPNDNSLTINLQTKYVEYQSVNLITEECLDLVFNLENNTDLINLSKKLMLGN